MTTCPKSAIVSIVAVGFSAATLISLGDPIPFPESGKYEFDFESDPIENGWTLEIETVDEFGDPLFNQFWSWQPIFESGVAEMNGTGNSQIRLSSGGFDDFEFAEDGAEFPLDALIAPQSYLDFGFSGDWLINNAAGRATENDEGQFVNENRGVARLEFTELPEHIAVSVALKIGVGGSIDGGNNEFRDGAFDIVVDGTEVFSHAFNASGSNLEGVQGVTALATNENLTPLYREQWNDNGGQGPGGPDDRSTLGWTLDSAYDLEAVQDLLSIPHTADSLTLEFVHRLSDGPADEHIALDDIAIELITDDAPALDAWPGGDTYTHNFDTAVGPEWNLGSEWLQVALPRGVDMMTASGGSPHPGASLSSPRRLW